MTDGEVSFLKNPFPVTVKILIGIHITNTESLETLGSLTINSNYKL